MKKYLIIAFAGIALFSACKKSGTGSSAPTIDPTDASAVSSSLKIWHGTNVTGTPPAPTNNGNSPMLNTGSSATAISAYKGGYAVITPSVNSGSVAGYYLQVNGASNYFKIDYSAALHRPAILQHRPAGTATHVHSAHHFAFRPAGGDSTANIDSTIVIQLPAGITPGTFCLSYWAYDYYGNISNVVTQCITVDSLGASDASDWAGTWKVDMEKEIDIDSTGFLLGDSSWHSVSDSVFAMSYTYNTGLDGSSRLYCDNGTITYDSVDAGSTVIAGFPSYYSWDNENITFSTNGAYSDIDNYIEKDADLNLSTCGNVIYDRDAQSYSDTGGWSYNPSTNKFTAIYYDGDDVSSNEATEFDVVSKTSTSITLKATDIEFGETSIEYVTLVKQ